MEEINKRLDYFYLKCKGGSKKAKAIHKEVLELIFPNAVKIIEATGKAGRFHDFEVFTENGDVIPVEIKQNKDQQFLDPIKLVDLSYEESVKTNLMSFLHSGSEEFKLLKVINTTYCKLFEHIMDDPEHIAFGWSSEKL